MGPSTNICSKIERDHSMRIKVGFLILHFIDNFVQFLASEVMLNVLMALDIIHGAGYVHRDLSPKNILIYSFSDDSMPIIVSLFISVVLTYSMFRELWTLVYRRRLVWSKTQSRELRASLMRKLIIRMF